MQILATAAVAATALATVITPTHAAAASCATNPATLVEAPVGATASCTGPVAPSSAWIAWGDNGRAKVRVVCPGYATDAWAEILPSLGTLNGVSGACTLTLTAVNAGTTAIGIVV